jgi:hypothetical protein
MPQPPATASGRIQAAYAVPSLTHASRSYGWCVSVLKVGSDSMLMHLVRTVGSESKGNRCRGQTNHSNAVRTDN